MNDLSAPIAFVPFDLYSDIHKAIRVAMFDVTAEAGRIDSSNRTARLAHAERVRDLVWLLRFHASHEDDHVEAVVVETLPERAEKIACDHRALDARMDRLVAIADLAFDETRDDARAALHLLYLELASFVAAYLVHQDVEERVVMPALWDHCGIERLLGIHNAILASIAPDVMARCLTMMLPAMNNDGRTELLGAMQADAPPEVFAGVCGLAADVLAEEDFAIVSARIGRTLATVVTGRGTPS